MSRWLAIGWVLLLGYSPAASPPLHYPGLVGRFYQQRNRQLYWFAPGQTSDQARSCLLAFIDSSAWLGLDSNHYRPALLRQLERTGEGQSLLERDFQYTDAALSLGLDVYRGAGMDSLMAYDGVSPVFAARDEQFILDRMIGAGEDGMAQYLHGLEPGFPGYLTLKTALREYIGRTDASAVRQLSISMNAFRWMHHFGFDRFVVVNIAGAGLRYYTGDSLRLQMRIVAGQVSRRTPRFAAWIDGLVLYPYWNIPRRIAVGEWLPLLRKDPGSASVMKIDVLDSRGRLVDPATVDWKTVHATDFPFTLRQAPGCFNALGVLKFEVSDPFDVYMHDTNFKGAFTSSSRYFSHGCIRLEKAAVLGDLLLDHRLDTMALQKCLRNQRPTPIRLARRVPVFVLYLTVVPDGAGDLHWFRDVYHLLS